jgi:hypothetical protein
VQIDTHQPKPQQQQQQQQEEEEAHGTKGMTRAVPNYRGVFAIEGAGPKLYEVRLNRNRLGTGEHYNDACM